MMTQPTRVVGSTTGNDKEFTSPLAFSVSPGFVALASIFALDCKVVELFNDISD